MEAAYAPPGFNARFDAAGKHYRYSVLNRPSPSPLRRKTHYFVPKPLEVDRMRRAASLIVGEHDFAAFRAKDCERATTVRRLTEVAVDFDEDSGILDIEVEGDAFLKNMVRIIAGTLIDAGRGAVSLQSIQEALEDGDRTRAGRTAPAHGLTLVSVFYPTGWLRKRG